MKKIGLLDKCLWNKLKTFMIMQITIMLLKDRGTRIMVHRLNQLTRRDTQLGRKEMTELMKKRQQWERVSNIMVMVVQKIH